MPLKLKSIIVTVSLAGIAGILSLRLLLLPILQTHVDSKLKAQLGEDFHYQKIEFSGLGFTLKRFRFAAHGFKLNTDLELKLSWNILQPRLTRINMIKPRLIVKKKPRVASGAIASDSKHSEFDPERLLKKWQDSGVTLQMIDGKATVFDANSQNLASFDSLELLLDAQMQQVQLSLQNLKYRQQTINEVLEGQILLESSRASYPIILQAKDPGGEPWQLTGHLRRDLNQLEIRHKRKGLPMNWLPYLNTVADPQDLLSLFKLRLQGIWKEEDLTYDLQLASSNLKLQHALLGEDVIGPLPFSLRMKGFLELDTGAFKIDQGLLFLSSRRAVKPFRIEFSANKADLLAPMHSNPLILDVAIPSTGCQTVLDTIPENFMPHIADFALEGNFQASARVQLVSVDKPFVLKSSAFGCKINAVPQIFTSAWLFDPSAKPSEQESFLKNPAMSRLKDAKVLNREMIPDDFFKALVAAEDSSFWRHDGVLFPSLIAALKANLKEGRVVYGASTLTMQLAKNLYLGHQRVVSRKVQELFLAWVLEQTLSKQEILELYANVVEFAPKVFGIRSASQLYFQKAPDQLSLAESLFLASILPSPQRNFNESYCQAHLSPTLEARMFNVAKNLQALANESDLMDAFSIDLKSLRFSAGDSQRGSACAIARRSIEQPMQKARF